MSRGCIALADARPNHSALKKKASAMATSSVLMRTVERKTEELNEGGAKVKLPAQHGPRPAVETMWPVDASFCATICRGRRHRCQCCVGPADEFADEYARRRREERGCGTCGRVAIYPLGKAVGLRASNQNERSLCSVVAPSA